MTPERAVELLKGELDSQFSPYISEALQMANNAIEKQIPKKVVDRENNRYIHELFCPNCDCYFGIYGDIFIPTTSEYCYECGQKLDWSD